MKEMGGLAEEIQTNAAMFASRTHKKRAGETINTDTQRLHRGLWQPVFGKAVTLNGGKPQCRDRRGMWLEWKVHICVQEVEKILRVLPAHPPIKGSSHPILSHVEKGILK